MPQHGHAAQDAHRAPGSIHPRVGGDRLFGRHDPFAAQELNRDHYGKVNRTVLVLQHRQPRGGILWSTVEFDEFDAAVGEPGH